MKLEAYIVNAFTEKIGCGNPAGVVLLDEIIPDELMQTIAFDINKSATAFISRIKSSDICEYTIRWFTPQKEDRLCGHATLAASKVIFTLQPDLKNILFRYGSGSLKISNSAKCGIEMDIPLDTYSECSILNEYYQFFKIQQIEKCIFGATTKKVILILPSDLDFSTISPDYSLMQKSSGMFINGIGISKKSNRYDFETRYFNPWFGVNEDPVTGSVHTVLAAYWGKELNKNHLIAYQISHRPGILNLTLKKDYVTISGEAKIVFEGYIIL